MAILKASIQNSIGISLMKLRDASKRAAALEIWKEFLHHNSHGQRAARIGKDDGAGGLEASSSQVLDG